MPPAAAGGLFSSHLPTTARICFENTLSYCWGYSMRSISLSTALQVGADLSEDFKVAPFGRRVRLGVMIWLQYQITGSE